MSAAAQLRQALAPLEERTKRRAERIKQLQAQPQTEQTVKAIAAEQREIALFMEAANNAGALLERIEGKARQDTQQASVAIGRVQQVVEDAGHYERLFHTTLDHADKLAVPLPDEKWPAVARTAHNAMYRILHMRTSPETYATTFGYPSSAA